MNDQRPWISLESRHLQSALSMEKPVGISFVLLNSGRTPALNVRVFATFFAAEAINESEFNRYPRGIFQSSEFVVGPNSKYVARTSLSKPIKSKEQMDSFNTGGKVRFYAVGTTLYDDIFGGSHSTNFSFRAVTENEPRTTMIFAGTGNSAD